MKSKIIATDKKHLQELIEEEIEANGNNCDLNHIDVSNIANMNFLFAYSEFNGDVSKWNTSRVEDMSYMFEASKFNGDISKWDVSNVKNMKGTFNNSEFSQDVSKWDVRNVDNMGSMFYQCPAPLPYWANYSEKAERVKSINAYNLEKELQENLSTCHTATKKPKI